MSNYEASNASRSEADYSEYSVDSENLDSPSGMKETEYINNDWSEQLGYYKNIPELKNSIDTIARWSVGKGYTAGPMTEFYLTAISGNGVDTFNTILENQIRVYFIGGDSFAEIIREDDILVNIKPLNPSRVKIIANDKGVIKRYEMLDNKGKQVQKKFKPEEILHLSKDRIGDEIHGQGRVEAVKDLIKKRNEAMDDWQKVLHRNVAPMWVFHLDTDDEDEINKLKRKFDTARENGDNMYVPKDAVVPEVTGTSQGHTLNPSVWVEKLGNEFYKAIGVPQIVIGGANEITEASAKIAYLAFQQTIEEEQLYIEEQIGKQLGLTINLQFPASLENELLSDKAKDKTNGAVKPNEVNTNLQGKR